MHRQKLTSVLFYRSEQPDIVCQCDLFVRCNPDCLRPHPHFPSDRQASSKKSGGKEEPISQRKRLVAPSRLKRACLECVMSQSQAIAKYVPFLRRYARALTGAQNSGDAYVAAALEAVVADPMLIQDAGNARVQLFQLFTKIWNSISVNDAVGDGLRPSDERLASLTPLPRQAFLLMALEGF
jgi:hypothetical protein